MPYTSIEKPEIDFAISTKQLCQKFEFKIMVNWWSTSCLSYFPQYRHTSDNDLERVTLFNCTLFRFYLQKWIFKNTFHFEMSYWRVTNRALLVHFRCMWSLYHQNQQFTGVLVGSNVACQWMLNTPPKIPKPTLRLRTVLDCFVNFQRHLFEFVIFDSSKKGPNCGVSFFNSPSPTDLPIVVHCYQLISLSLGSPNYFLTSA